ncbi:MAG: MATE family efflux transporter [Treponema sp.]|nr:MATE family efflux transporter [Treponema sp.]
MASENFDISKLIQQNNNFSQKTLLSYVWRLSVPSIFAQISSIVMQYIDAAMVGHIGANAAAAIGLVSPSMWLFGGICHSFSTGFIVQVAQAVGAGERQRAKQLLRESIVACIAVAGIVAAISCAISGKLPVLLGAEHAIHHDASIYFFVFQLTLPIFQIVYLFSGMLQASGDMKTPGILNALMCALDVAFNYVFIVVLEYGVAGAAYGSVCAAVITAALIVYATLVRSPYLNMQKRSEDVAQHSCSWKIDKDDLRRAVKIALPIAGERVAMSGAMVATTGLIAPLGAVPLAANSFAVTAESLCYMPGYGIEEAAMTLVGQSVGAKRSDLAKRFAWLTVASGMVIMALAGLVMYAACPTVFAFLTNDAAVQLLATSVLRLELVAEPFFAASIVASGALRGAGDTFIPSVMNFGSIWGVRIVLAVLLVPRFGLHGAWIAMCAELCFRGIIFLIRLARKKWERC